MKSEIEIECKHPEEVIKSLEPDLEETAKFNVRLDSEKNKIKLKVESKELSGLLAGINSYLRLIKTTMDALE